MITINQIKISTNKIKIDNKINSIKERAAELLRINIKEIKDLIIIKESLDARKKPNIFYVYNIAISLNDKKIENRLLSQKNKNGLSINIYNKKIYEFPYINDSSDSTQRPIIVGSGPAGLFCAYMLSENGYLPIIIDRGMTIEERKLQIKEFLKTGKINPDSNVQFGEGGAGTYSDGKLNTGTKDSRGLHQRVLEIFVKHGASKEILYSSKPHLGTDVLEKVISSMREYMQSLGAEFRFNSKLTGLIIKNNSISGIKINNSEIISTNNIILAIGHSARDTFRMLSENNIEMEPKPFAVGVRVVHEQSKINKSQYDLDIKNLPSADYKITTHTSNGRSVYSFCMCPGGYVINASSGENQCVVNGMSYSGRNAKYANSAIVVNVNSEDFGSDDLFSGMEFQQNLEKYAFNIGNGKIPIQSSYGFINNIVDTELMDLFSVAKESILGNVNPANVRSIFPKHLGDALSEGIRLSDRYINGFSTDIKLIAGVETRTSSPVRINRNQCFMSNVRGIFPCGEGAGYAGGIMSASVDGIKTAEMVALTINGGKYGSESN